MLRRLDPVRAKTIEKQNPVRLIRAIEIAKVLGRVPKPKNAHTAIYQSYWIGISPDEEKLRGLIHKRLLARLRRGMIAEARRLRRGGLSLRRMRALGLEYRFLADHLEGKTSKGQLIDGLESAIRQYAKRQMRWWKRNEEIQWFPSKRGHSIADYLKKIALTS